MFLIIRLIIMALLIAWLCQQVRKPSGWLGRRIAGTMNLSHAKIDRLGAATGECAQERHHP
jgi:hypothetical protein